MEQNKFLNHELWLNFPENLISKTPLNSRVVLGIMNPKDLPSIQQNDQMTLKINFIIS